MYTCACQAQSCALLFLLLDISCAMHNASSQDGRTPLYWACMQGHASVVKKLIEKGASFEQERDVSG